MTDTIGPRFSAALAFANELHGSQLRMGTQIPYIGHLLSVAALVIEHGGDEDEAIAALLHDAVEDQGGRPTLDRIRSQFGPRVADIVNTQRRVVQHHFTDTFQTTDRPTNHSEHVIEGPARLKIAFQQSVSRDSQVFDSESAVVGMPLPARRFGLRRPFNCVAKTR